MKRKRIATLMILSMVLIAPQARANLLVFDPINGAYNEIRNALMEIYHLEDIKNAIDQLTQLQSTFSEMKRFNGGVDEIFSRFLGDFKSILYRNNPASLSSMGFNLSVPQMEFYELVNGVTGSGSSNYKNQLDSIFGKDPNSAARPYITQEELAAADGYRWSGEVRRATGQTIAVGEDISVAAQAASPKGAARLTADALGKILVTQAQIQQNQSKLIEIGSVQIEQVSREEKYYERERLRFMEDFNEVVIDMPGR